MAKLELIPRDRASVVCCRGDFLLTIKAVDPVSARHYLFLPGGGIEQGETPAATAVRETLEETGYRVTVEPADLMRAYDFEWAGKMYACRTWFFKAALLDADAAPEEVHDDDFIKGVEWLPIAEVESTFAYSPLIVEVVKQLL